MDYWICYSRYVYISLTLWNDSGAPSEGTIWLLDCMPLWFGQNINVYAVRLSFRLYSKHDDIIKISLLCSDVSISIWMRFPYNKKKTAIVTPGFCVWVCVHLCVRVSELMGELIPEVLSFLTPLPLKRWNLHRPVFENSPQPQAGGLWQSHPTTAGNAALTGSHHLCQWRRHTVRSAAHSGFTHVVQAP